MKLNFLERPTQQMDASLQKERCKLLLRCLHQAARKRCNHFIGMINYLSKFSARLSELALPVRELAKDKVPFNWSPKHQAAFKLAKNEIITAPILAYYDPKKLTVLQMDASINGLGACLLQDEKPVYFMSKALTEAQCGYIAIEFESLTVAWVMEMFHCFLYGNHFILETDQKPMETILASIKLPPDCREY